MFQCIVYWDVGAGQLIRYFVVQFDLNSICKGNFTGGFFFNHYIEPLFVVEYLNHIEPSIKT